MFEMVWAWNIRNNVTPGDEVNGGSPVSKELATQLYKSIDRSKWKTLGPPSTQFPLTTSIEAPFAGPHIVVPNHGIFFNGWHLHIPQLLISGHLNITQPHLGELCMNRWDWGSDNEENSVSPSKKELVERIAIIKATQNQRKVADFL
jgi:hypothetical protein